MTTKTKFKPVPRLEPGVYSAAEVLRFVRRLIKAEPLRLEMARWETAWKGITNRINIATGHRAGNIERNEVTPGIRALVHLGLLSKARAGDLSVRCNLTGAADALDTLFGRTELNGPLVAEELTLILQEHKAELTATKVTIR